MRSLPGKIVALSIAIGTSVTLYAVPHTFESKPEVAIPKVFPTYEQVYNQLMNLSGGAVRKAQLSNYSITKDVGLFNLEEGDLYLLNGIDGRNVALYFVGTGSFAFTPPTKLEQEHLFRYYETRSWESQFKTLFILAGDSTIARVEEQFEFLPVDRPEDFSEDIEFNLTYFTDRETKYIEPNIMSSMLNSIESDLFHAQMTDDPLEPMFFNIVPTEMEEIRFSRRAKVGRLNPAPEIVNQFHKMSDYQDKTTKIDDGRRAMKITHFEIESTIARDQKFSSTATLSYQLADTVDSWVPLQLYHELNIDSILTTHGDHLPFLREKGSRIFWIRVPAQKISTDSMGLTIYSQGSLIDEFRDLSWFFVKSVSNWYPRYDFQALATFRLTFHNSAKRTVVSQGELVSTTRDGDVVTTVWQPRVPVKTSSFNIGDYDEYPLVYPDVPPMTILISGQGHRKIGRMTIKRGGMVGKNMEQQVGLDVAQSYALFSDLFGPLDISQLYAVETPYTHGVAFPGFIQLSWTTFQNTDIHGYDALFRAHEVAHQWWGIGTDYETYHDQWLSEGLSNFSGLRFIQNSYGGNREYLTILKGWRKEIIANRKYIIGSGQKGAPLIFGYRTNSTTTEGDFNLIVYKKGAWVFQMLRMLMINLETMDDSAFDDMMREYFQTYAGGKSTTAGFAKIVEKHAGVNMDWFFDQWVYGTETPLYKYSYKIKETTDGKHDIAVKIEQSGVPDGFQMMVPLEIDFGEGQYAYQRIWVRKPVTELVLQSFDLKPKKLRLNPLESVLAKVKRVRWRK